MQATLTQNEYEFPTRVFGFLICTVIAFAFAQQLIRKLIKARWDVDEAVISYIENGKRILTDIELSMILSILGATLADLERMYYRQKK